VSDDEIFRFGFEEGDEEDRRPRSAPKEPEAPQDTLVGRDADGVVTVAVNDGAEFQSVTIATQWRQSVDPRVLGSAVTQAANAASMAALVQQIERPAEPAPRQVAPPPQSDERITPEQALRLMDAVSADLARFTQRMSEVVDRPLTVESRGGHVRGTTHRGQVLNLEVDPAWTHSARVSEMQQEFLEVLRNLRAQSVPADLAQGPHSPAIAELTALVSDPNALLRRVGLLP
jgi:DNA-binding protein YbaB